MASNSNEYTPQQYRKYNGQTVFKALSAMGNEASADELANFISEDIGTMEEVILPEVKQVLRRGITNGFLQRNGQYYRLIGEDHIMQVDSAPSSSRARAHKRGSRPVPSSSKMEENLSDEEVDEEEESVEDEDEHENLEDEMQADSSAVFQPPKVKLYEIYRPPQTAESDEEQSEEHSEVDDYDQPPPQKRGRLLPALSRTVKKR